MAKKQKVQMPAGIRNKLMAAVSMLLVSSIMMVSTTYAWFTLSTAPEVTGITTSVGANGNLEMALLTSETFTDLNKITSGVGNSSAATGNTLVKANATWGNLVDLSDVSYGLNLIALQPAALNVSNSKAVEETGATPVISAENMLQTPDYGKDGRVAEVKANTISGIYQGTKFVKEEKVTTTDGATTYDQSYGVRVVGVNSDLSDQEIILNAAKAAYRSSVSGATSAISNAVNANSEEFFELAMTLTGSSSVANYTEAQLKAMKAVANGVQTSLNTIVKAYSNAILAKAATVSTVDAEVLGLLQGQLTNNTSASAVAELLKDVSDVNDYTDTLTQLAAAQEEVKEVITELGGYTSSTAAATVQTTLEKLVGDKSDMTAYNKNGESVALSSETATQVIGGSLYVGGGLLGTVGTYAGSYKMTNYVADIYGGKKDAVGTLVDVTSAVNRLEITKDETENAGTATETVISDYYGYIIDFAFRTNAASSYLQLQTEGVNRVYSDGGEATQGSGSNVTFTYGAGLTSAQAEKLLGSIKMVFLDPATGTVYAEAGLKNIQPNTAENATSSTAEIQLTKQYVTLSEGVTNASAILSLQQNTATKLSVLVYLDGEAVDNTAVLATAASSGTLDLNLQFSSSAELVPMSNTALKNLTITYTEKTLTDSKYTYNGKDYTVKTGYKLYDGSDNTVYFAKDVTGDGTPTYVKLTASNYTTALEAVESADDKQQTNVPEEDKDTPREETETKD